MIVFDDKKYNYLPQSQILIDKSSSLDLLKQILSYLNREKDIKSAARVNKRWNKASVEIKMDEFTLIKQFVKCLGKNINKEIYQSSQNNLLKFVNDLPTFGLVNLSAIKSSTLESKEAILNILKDLTTQDLENLEKLTKDVNKPKLFENIFILAKIYRRLEEARNIDKNQRFKVLKNICREFVKKQQFNKAIETALMMPYEKDIAFECIYEKDITFQYVFEKFNKNNFLNKATVVALKMAFEEEKSSALRYLVNAFIKDKQFDNAIETALKIPHDNDKYMAIQVLIVELGRYNRLIKMIELARKIPFKEKIYLNEEIKQAQFLSIDHIAKTMDVQSQDKLYRDILSEYYNYPEIVEMIENVLKQRNVIKIQKINSVL